MAEDDRIDHNDEPDQEPAEHPAEQPTPGEIRPAYIPIEPRQPRAEQPAPPPGPPRRDTDNLITLGWILVILGFFFCCCGPLFSIPGIILGAIAYSRGDQRGLPIIIVGAVALLFGGGSNLFWGLHWGPRMRTPWPLPNGRPV